MALPSQTKISHYLFSAAFALYIYTGVPRDFKSDTKIYLSLGIEKRLYTIRHSCGEEREKEGIGMSINQKRPFATQILIILFYAISSIAIFWSSRTRKSSLTHQKNFIV
jgi:hypothetical protein